MNPDILLKVVGYAVIPLLMAWIGNHLASKIIENKKRRRMYRIAFIVLVVVGVGGTWLVEWRSDLAHTKEVSENKDAVSHLQATLTATQVQNASDMGYLKGRLDAALDRPQLDMGQFAKSLAVSSSALIQAQVKIESSQELKAEAIQLVRDMRVFESQYKQRESAISDRELSNSSTTPLQRQEFFQKLASDDLQLSAEETLEFRNQFLARAVTLRDEMVAKIGKTKPLPDISRYRLIAFEGVLAGPSPVADAADYLETLAMLLPGVGTKQP